MAAPRHPPLTEGSPAALAATTHLHPAPLPTSLPRHPDNAYRPPYSPLAPYLLASLTRSVEVMQCSHCKTPCAPPPTQAHLLALLRRSVVRRHLRLQPRPLLRGVRQLAERVGQLAAWVVG